MKTKHLISLVLFSVLFCIKSYAQSTGNTFSFSLLGGQTSAEQKHINTLQDRANLREGGISVKALEKGWEFGATAQYKFGMSAVALRYTHFMQSQDGSGNSKNFEYEVSGNNLAFLYRVYPLENADMSFFFQTGFVLGMLDASIKEDSFQTKANGSDLGYQIGAGIELYFDSHVLSAEVGWRYLNVPRLTVSSSSGSPAADSISQSSVNQELEYDQRDFGSNMSGTQIFCSYGLRF